MREMVIMRGLPGAGKSTWANQLVGSAVVVSADQHYPTFKMKGLPEKEARRLAHGQCFRRAVEGCQKEFPRIVIDNTNVEIVEFAPYVAMARAYGYAIRFVDVGGRSDYDLEKYAKRNVHEVSIEMLRRRQHQWEDFTDFPVYWAPYAYDHVSDDGPQNGITVTGP